jgi:uncharacterized protein (DUF885 family)
MTESAIDRFFTHYFALRPVNATFTGQHDTDSLLPDWSPAGLERLTTDASAVRAALAEGDGATLAPAHLMARNWDHIDRALADAFLEIQLAVIGGRHFMRGNPSLAAGEAIFSIISLITRDFAPAAERANAVIGRLEAIPAFLQGAFETLASAPLRGEWTAKAARECSAGAGLLRDGLPIWSARMRLDTKLCARMTASAERAASALEHFAVMISAHQSTDDRYGCGEEMLELLVRRGHWCERSLADIRQEAQARLAEEEARLRERSSAVHPDGWPGIQAELSSRHPSASGYLSAFSNCWFAAREHAIRHDLLSWPEWPVQYVEIPEWTRDAAPRLYYLFYRSPAAFDATPVVDYVVTPLPSDEEAQTRHLRAWNDSVIKLNHVVHHGSIGHHVQNWHASRAPSRVGRIAAMDCASRIGMFSGGTMAEGWACYATDLMDETGFLTPFESIAEQHTRVRLLARMIVDIDLHTERMTLHDASRFYRDRVGMPPEAARAEAVKNSMFPGTAMMYWLGLSALHELRRDREAREGASFSLRRFHDQVLSFGSIPVLLTSRVMRSNG